MAITTVWNVTQMDAYPEVDGHADVVITAYWRLTATDGTYTASMPGAVSFALDPSESFTPYPDLTEAQVVGWVQGVYGSAYTASLEASVTEEVALLANPPIVSPPLPWEAA
jgi:hypothetical protein